jgi:oxygen-independent coproporphyrinogen-3 oxidase
MNQLVLPPLSLYVHIPWCQRKCPYCDFNSHESGKALPESDYVDALLRDLGQDLELAQGRALHSIFIGGGTPSLFSAQAIERLLRGISAQIDIVEEAEITLEANPGSAEAEKFGAFVEAGVNRISLGIQSFDDKLLAALGRVHNSDQAHCAIEMVQGVGLASFNIDLMHGLPGQSVADAQADLHRAASYRPPHISWYQLTVEPNTEFYSRPPRLPAESELAKIQDNGESVLREEGYAAYEVSAWAQTGYRCVHNLNYWQFGDYLGIGAGAHGKISDLESGRIMRLAKRRQPDGYLNAENGVYRSDMRVLTPEDLRGEYMLNALRLRDGFELRDFSTRTGLGHERIEDTLQSLLERELLEIEDSRVRASQLGWRFLDSVIAEFFED